MITDRELMPEDYFGAYMQTYLERDIRNLIAVKDENKHPYSGNIIKRVVKRPKLYFMDTGLACYLTYWNNPRALELSAMAGAMFENYAVSEIIKGYANQGIDVRNRFCYYRDNNGREIDLMILENGRLYPIEIKKSADPGKSALKKFQHIRQSAGGNRRRCSHLHDSCRNTAG